MKRIVTLLAAAALAGSALYAVPAAAQDAAPAVPETVSIEDPFGDANTLGDDQVTPQDGSTVADLGKVWFSHDATNFNIHVLTEGPPGANTVGLQFVVTAGAEGCAVFSGYYKGVTYVSDGFSRLVDNCNGQDPLDGTFTFVEAAEGGGLATMTFPRADAPFLADGSAISAPFAQSWIFAGGEQLTPSGYRGLRNMVDDTKAGTDYAIAAGEAPASPEPTKPPKAPKPGKGKPKGCDKGKGAKKGCKPPVPTPAGCTPFVPGEKGKDAETIVLTDAATAEAPIEKKVDMEFGWTDYLPDQADQHSHQYFNVQVDPAAAEAGLWAHLEFNDRRDLDLELTYPNGNQAAASGGFNPHHPSDLSDSGHGGESTTHSETLVGIRTSDCGGYTLDVANAAGEAQTVTLTLWLGDAQTDPLPPEGEAPAE